MSGRLIVLKFGGTSLGTRVRVQRAARRVRAHLLRGRQPVVVVSANGHTTDRILARLGGVARTAHVSFLSREADRALGTGEDLSAALFACALLELGVPARSLRGSEAGIEVEGDFGAGRIGTVRPERIRELLEQGVVPVVSGFQGGRADGETITLGRGGSDTSAVAIAAALGPVPCHIVTDVDAVYDRDPRLHPDAIPFRALTHDDLLELVQAGAQVIHPAAAAIARSAGVPLLVYHYRAPLSGRVGTRVRAPLEPAKVAAIVEDALDTDRILITQTSRVR